MILLGASSRDIKKISKKKGTAQGTLTQLCHKIGRIENKLK